MNKSSIFFHSSMCEMNEDFDKKQWQKIKVKKSKYKEDQINFSKI